MSSTPGPAKCLNANRSSSSDIGAGEGERLTWRVKADNPFDAKNLPAVPKLRSPHPVNKGVYARSKDASAVADSRGMFDVVVTYAPMHAGDEVWECTGLNWTEKVFYALDKPRVLYEDPSAPVDSGDLVGLNPKTGEVAGFDIECSGAVITVTQYREEIASWAIIIRKLIETKGKINKNIFFGFPPRCVFFYDFSMQPVQDGLRPVVYIFHIRPPKDLSDISIVTGTGQEITLEGDMGGYEYLDRLVGEKPSEDKTKTLHFTRKVQVARLYHTSEFSALQLSGALT